MENAGATVDVAMGFLPRVHAMADPDHPGLLRAGERASGPYGNDRVERHECPATDCAADGAVQPDLLAFGFEAVDLSSFHGLQDAFASARAGGRLDDADAATIRDELEGAVLPLAGGRTLHVLHLAGEGFIMRTGGPNGIAVGDGSSSGANGHGVATSVHGDQDVFGTPLTQLMDGRAPSLFRHDSPDGHNHDARLLLINLWIPLQQVVQPLVLADGRSIDRPRHQLRYGLPTDSFLDREDEMAINDIWTFLHDPGQRWYFRSQMDHRQAYVFNTLSTPHGAGTLPGEDVAERCYRALEAAEGAVGRGEVAALRETLADALPVAVPHGVTPALADAISAMVTVLDEANRDADAVCGAGAPAWSAASQAARRGVVRMSLELRLVVSIQER